MLDAAASEALTRSLMLGTARQPVPVDRAFGGVIDPSDPKATLKILALLAQRNRFRRPPRASSIAARGLFPDARRTIPDQARPLLISLVSGKADMAWDVAAFAIADAMARKRLKLHPFDLPRLESFVKAHCERLGPSALAWTERHATNASVDPMTYSFD